MVLALELLKQQRFDTVLRFLKDWEHLCDRNAVIQLQNWSTEIRRGEIPDFGPSLLR